MREPRLGSTAPSHRRCVSPLLLVFSPSVLRCRGPGNDQEKRPDSSSRRAILGLCCRRGPRACGWCRQMSRRRDGRAGPAIGRLCGARCEGRGGRSVWLVGLRGGSCAPSRCAVAEWCSQRTLKVENGPSSGRRTTQVPLISSSPQQTGTSLHGQRGHHQRFGFLPSPRAASPCPRRKGAPTSIRRPRLSCSPLSFLRPASAASLLPGVVDRRPSRPIPPARSSRRLSAARGRS